MNIFPLKKKHFLFALLLLVLLVAFFPSYIFIRNVQNDMPLREYVKITLLPRIKTDMKRFFTFSSSKKIDISVLYLEIDKNELEKLELQRTVRLTKIDNNKTNLIGQEQWSFVNARLKHNGEQYNIKIRLRGDMPSNYNRGLEKASYRFNIEGNAALFGKKKLSLVRTFLENNFYSYLFSEFMDNEGFVSNDVKFVRVFFNGEDTGICFLQEGFSKELAESSEYREGTILRFKNDCVDNDGEYNISGIPELVAYAENRVLKDTLKSEIYSRAIMKFDLLKEGKISQCFNTHKFAKYLALCDIFLAHHSYACHNTKLYFNPVNDKFEPVAWDPQSFMRYKIQLPVERGFNEVAGEIYNNVRLHPVYHFLFSDTTFLKEFNSNLFDYSIDSSIAKLIQQHQQIISYLDPVLYRQRFQEIFKPEIILRHIDEIHHWYSTNARLTARVFSEDKILVVKSNIPITIHLKQLNLDSSNTIPLNKILLPFASDTIFLTNNNVRENDVKFNLFSSVYGVENTELKYKGNIFRKMDVYNNPLVMEKTDWNLLKIDSVKKIISFKSQNVHLKENLFIPAGYKFVIEKNSTIYLTGNFVSESAVEAKGKDREKIVIKSDGTSGFFVKNTEQLSQLEYVEFDNLSNPRQGNWSLTGAVTFYEADVHFSNCMFKNNNSEDALNIIRSNFLIENTQISNTSSDAFDIDFSRGKILNLAIENTQNDALDFSGSDVEAENISFVNIGDKAVSGGENSKINIKNISLTNCFVGITAKDNSVVKAENVEMHSVKYSFATYQKKAEYGPAILLVNNFSGEKNSIIEKNSLLLLNGDSVKGSDNNVYENLYKKL